MATVVVNAAFEKYDVYVDRPSGWGNPYAWVDGTSAFWRVGSPEEAAALYKKYLDDNPALVDRARRLLYGRRLGCFCPQGQPCHAKVLAELVDRLGPLPPE